MSHTPNTTAKMTGREKILMAAFQEMHENGYQGMRIDAILESTGLTKGAIYHHFATKKELAYAIIDELLLNFARRRFDTQAVNKDDPLDALCNTIETLSERVSDRATELGCPINNLVQEMSNLDEGFRERLKNIYETWQELIKNALIQAKSLKLISENLDVDAAALFIVCHIQGTASAAKCLKSKYVFEQQSIMLCEYIQSLRDKNRTPHPSNS